MKQLLFALLPAALLAACSTNPDGSVNWSDNPLNKVATQVDNGVQKLNRNTDKVITKTGGGDRFGNHCVTCDDKGVSHKQMLEWGYIRLSEILFPTLCLHFAQLRQNAPVAVLPPQQGYCRTAVGIPRYFQAA